MITRQTLFSFGLCLSITQAQTSLREGGWSLLNGVDGYHSSIAAGEGVLIASVESPPNVFRSLDSGKTWRPFRVPGSPIHGFKVHFDPASKLFYCSSDSLLYIAAPTALDWTRLTEFPKSIWKFSTDGPTLLVLAGEAHVSQTGGRTWKTSRYLELGNNIMGFLAADSCAYVGDSDAPVSVSCDGGNTWIPAGSGNLTNYTYAMVHHQKAVIAAAGEGLVRSLDRGRTWTSWAGNLADGKSITRMNQSGGSLFAWQNPDGMPNTRKIHRSEDGGQSWKTVTSITSVVSSVLFLPDAFANLGGLLFGFNFLYGLMSISDAENTWNPAPIGRIQSQIRSLGIHKNRYLVFTDRGVFSSEDTASTWKTALGNDSAITWTAFGGNAPHFAAGNRAGEIRVTTDAGATWSAPIPLPQSTPVLSLSILDHVLYVGTADALWRLGHDGGSWSKTTLPNGEAPWILTAGRQSMLIGTASRIWEMRGDGTFLDRTVGVDPLLVSGLWMVDDRLFANNRAGILYQWDGERDSWKPIQGLTGPAYSITGSGDRMVVSSGDVSEDGGETWHSLYPIPGQQSLFGPSLFSLTFSDGHAYGGDGRGGVWRLLPAFADEGVGLLQKNDKRAVINSPSSLIFLKDGDIRIDGRRTRPKLP